MATTPDVQTLQQRLNADPRVQALLREASTARGPRGMASVEAIQAGLARLGIALPHDYYLAPDGQITRKDFIARNGWVLPVAAFGGLAAGGALAAGAGGAAAGAGAGGAAMPTAGPITSAGMSAAMPGSMATVGAGGVGMGGAGMAASGGSGILGQLGKWGEIARDVGPVLGGAASGMAEGRRADAALNNDAIARNNQAGLDAARFNRDLPTVRAAQTARGEVLNTMQNAPLTGDARIDKFAGGGLRPSAFGPQSRQAGAELSRQALTALMNPASDRFTPERIEPTRGGTVENIMGGVGIGADIFSLLAKYGGRR